MAPELTPELSPELTPETILLVQQSFRWLLPEAELAGAAFFARLGRDAPDLARLLPTRNSERRRRLVAVFSFAVATLEDFDNMRPALRAAGAHYQALGVGSDDYARFGSVLLGTLEQVLGRAWNPHLAAAWGEAWEALASVMKAAAAETRAAA